MIDIRGIVLTMMAGLLLGSCQNSAWLPRNLPPADYKARHPILPAGTVRTVNLSVNDPQLSRPAADAAAKFGAEFVQQYGRQLEIAMSEWASRNTDLPGQTAAVLSQSGVPLHKLKRRVVAYLPGNISLRYTVPKTSVASVCGNWPQDVASGSGTLQWANQSYSDFGCSTQHNLVAQIADSRDLFRPRAQTPIVTGRRLIAVEKWRQGEDPSTTAQKLEKIAK